MPTEADLEDLERAANELEAIDMKYPDAFEEFSEFFQRNRGLGYKNLSRLLMGEQTPRELKGLDEETQAEESA